MRRLHCLFSVLAMYAGVCEAAGKGTAFTCNGGISFSGGPTSGTYDLTFTVYDAPTNGNLLGSPTNAANGAGSPPRSI